MTSVLESSPRVEAPEKLPPDLLRFRPLRRLVLSRFYPGLFQVISLAVFGAIIGFGFFGPPMGDDNFAVAVTWRLWWLVLPFSFVLLGRFWCAVCPVGATVDLVSPRLPWGRRSPGAFIQKQGAWIMAGLYLVLFWAGMLGHVCCWPQATALWLLGFGGTALSLALIYERRVWCRYLCPVAAFGGLYSMTAPLQLRAQQDSCRQCYTQRRGWLRQERRDCPFFELPMALSSNQNCNLCARCLKNCHVAALRWELRPPAQETWQPRRSPWAQAALVLLLATLALVEALQITTILPAYMKWGLESGLGLEYDALFTLTLLVGGTVLALLYLGANALSGADEGSRFSFAYLPLVAAGYLGTMAFRLAMQGGRALEVALSQLGLLPWEVLPPIRGSTYYIIPEVKTIQLIILGVGLALTLYGLRRMGKDLSWHPLRLAPHLLFALFLGGVFGYLFTLPGAVILH